MRKLKSNLKSLAELLSTEAAISGSLKGSKAQSIFLLIFFDFDLPIGKPLVSVVTLLYVFFFS